jgi:hypothetical protein
MMFILGCGTRRVGCHFIAEVGVEESILRTSVTPDLRLKTVSNGGENGEHSDLETDWCRIYTTRIQR